MNARRRPSKRTPSRTGLIPYGNRSGNSGVTAFEIGDEEIKVQFRHSGKIYVYDWNKPGSRHVKEMKKRALSEKGLSTYISQHVGDNYSRIE